MTMTARAEGGTPYSDINMTPLIDVMLVLLIIFIITIPQQTHSIKMDNPARNPPSAKQTEVVNLSIDFDGVLYWNRRRVDRATFLSLVNQEATKPVQPEVHITVDQFSRYEHVAQTLADLQHRGMRKIGFVNNGSPN